MKKALVIDDDKDVNSILQIFLKKKGVDVSSASSGKEGLELLEKEEFDVVFLDMLMPELSGKETLMKIRENPKTKETRVVILTAKELSAKEREELTALNMMKYIQKSTYLIQDMEKLIEHIKSL